MSKWLTFACVHYAFDTCQWSSQCWHQVSEEEREWGVRAKTGPIKFDRGKCQNKYPATVRDRTIGWGHTGGIDCRVEYRDDLILGSKYMESSSKETKTIKCRGQHLTFKVHSKTIRVQIQDREGPKIRFRMTLSNVPQSLNMILYCKFILGYKVNVYRKSNFFYL